MESIRERNPGQILPVRTDPEQFLFQAVKVILHRFHQAKAHFQGTVSIADEDKMVQLSEISNLLTVPRLSEAPIKIFLADENDSPADLSDVTDAKFEMKSSFSGSAVLTRSIGGTNITKNVNDSSLEIDAISSIEWASIPAGRYLADLIVEIAGKEHRTRTFYVDIANEISGAIS